MACICAAFRDIDEPLIEKPMESLAGLEITIIGIPVYYYWKKAVVKIPYKKIKFQGVHYQLH